MVKPNVINLRRKPRALSFPQGLIYWEEMVVVVKGSLSLSVLPLGNGLKAAVLTHETRSNKGPKVACGLKRCRVSYKEYKWSSCT